jgi:hypothetical protein
LWGKLRSLSSIKEKKFKQIHINEKKKFVDKYYTVASVKKMTILVESGFSPVSQKLEEIMLTDLDPSFNLVRNQQS